MTEWALGPERTRSLSSSCKILCCRGEKRRASEEKKVGNEKDAVRLRLRLKGGGGGGGGGKKPQKKHPIKREKV